MGEELISDYFVAVKPKWLSAIMVMEKVSYDTELSCPHIDVAPDFLDGSHDQPRVSAPTIMNRSENSQGEDLETGKHGAWTL